MQTKNGSYEKEDFFIIYNDDNAGPAKIDSAVLVCCLYYVDTTKDYLERLALISRDVDVIIVSSQNEILELAKESFYDCERIRYIHKENRGRDISALLIAVKGYIQKYNYFGFIHDKKTIDKQFVDDTDLWIENMWSSIVGKNGYINNVIDFFDNNPEYGLLVPPQRFGRYFHDWEYSEWTNEDYDEIQKLAERIGIKTHIDRNEQPVALGTTFWCRTKALEKLLTYPWKYEDFPEEPLPYDGTISHAIERSFSYVAKDMGYETAIVVNSEFAPKLLRHTKDYSQNAYELINESFGLRNIAEMEYASEVIKKIKEEQELGKKVYLYGAGKEGIYCLHYLRAGGVVPECFVISGMVKNSLIEGVNVKSVNDISHEIGDGIVVITVYDNNDKMVIREKLCGLEACNIINWRV